MSARPSSGGPRSRRPDTADGTPVATTARRRSAWAAVLAVLTAVLVAAAPGVAAAGTTSTVKPILDCYTQNRDGSFTVIVGYSNPRSGTTTVPLGPRNIGYPARLQGIQPTQFKPGTYHAVFSARVTQAEIYANARWELDGNVLNYLAARNVSGICSPSTELPAFGNGTAIAVALLGSTVVGLVVVRRGIRRAARTP